MLQERLEPKWIDCFARVFRHNGVRAGDVCAILSESQSRPILVALAEHGLARCGARLFHLVLPSPPLAGPIPLRSTGTTLAVGGLAPAVDALAACSLVVDCTVEGLLHAAERAAVLARGARIVMVSDEHPEVLERLEPDPALVDPIASGVALLRAAREMRVTSPHGTDLRIDLTDAPARGSAGVSAEPGTITYWPAGLCLCFPRPGSVEGCVVLAPGDANLTFKRHLREPVRLAVRDDRVTAIDGEGLDADMLRDHLAAWDEPDAFAVSHVGWGMNPRARWDALTFYDRRDVNGTELRAFAGNFLFSTGANEHAGRFSRCHFDWPMRGCTVTLDGAPVVEGGRVVWERFGGRPTPAAPR